MKTVVGFTMALGTLVVATAADADVRERQCEVRVSLISVRAGTPCIFRPLDRTSFRGGALTLYSTEITEPPHEGTAVLRADGSIHYSPKPGFTGRDSMTVQRAACIPRNENPTGIFSGTWHADPSGDRCGHLTRAFAIFVE
jgi:hypothetical protein